MSPLSPDDPRFTAYADGELSGEEAERFEAELAAHPEARVWLEQTRAVQEGLRAALNEEAAEEDATAAAEEACIVNLDTRSASPHGSDRGWWGNLAALAAALALVVVVILPSVGKVRESSFRQVAASNLRQIGQASLIYAYHHGDRLPQAESVWAYAAELARHAGLNDGWVWVVSSDPASAGWRARDPRVVDERREALASFLALKPGVAVPLGELRADMGSQVPIAWTRGLQEDGTWAEHAPYGTSGGHVVFFGGNVRFYRDLKGDGGELVRFADGGKTASILEALPPGTRIGEYAPTEEEAASWAREYRARRQMERMVSFWLHPGMWVVYAVVGLCVVGWAVRRWGSLWVWVLLAGVVVMAVLVPCCGRVR